MKIVLICLVAVAAVITTLSGLLMVNYPNGVIPGMLYDVLQGSALKNLFIPVIPGLTLIIVGVIHIAAFFSLLHSGESQYRRSMMAGALLFFSMIVTISVTSIYLPLQFFVAGAGVMIVLLSLQLKGKWAA